MSSDPLKTFILGRNVDGNDKYLCFPEKSVVSTGQLRVVSNGPEVSATGQLIAAASPGYEWKDASEVNLTTPITVNKFSPLAFTTKGNQGSSLLSFQFVKSTVSSVGQIQSNPNMIIQPGQYIIAAVSTNSNIPLRYLASVNDNTFLGIPDNNQATLFNLSSANIKTGALISSQIGTTQTNLFLVGWAPNSNLGPYKWGEYFSNCLSQNFPYTCPTDFLCTNQVCVPLNDNGDDSDPVPDPGDPDDTERRKPMMRMRQTTKQMMTELFLQSWTIPV